MAEEPYDPDMDGRDLDFEGLMLSIVKEPLAVLAYSPFASEKMHDDYLLFYVQWDEDYPEMVSRAYILYNVTYDSPEDF